MPDVTAADFQRNQARADTLEKENKALRAELRKLKEDHAALQVTHAEVINTTGYKKKVAYEYKENECRPISLGEVCEKCGYDYRSDSQRFMMRPNDKAREPHPTNHV